MTAANPDAWGLGIFDHHRKMLEASGITASHARARGYRSIGSGNRKVLAEIGIVKAVRSSDGLLIPLLRIDGEVGGWQFRPDNPRVKDGKEIKYETPWKQPNMLDFPPGVAERLKDRSTPIWLTEGVKKTDAGFCAGLVIVGLTGVWNWLKDGAALPDFRDLALKDREMILGFDSDLIIKDGVWTAVRDLGEWLKISRHADVKYCCLPHNGDGKTGLDDYLAAGHTVDELRTLIQSDLPSRPNDKPKPDPEPATPPLPEPTTLTETLSVFRRWLHLDDTAPVLAVAATIVANRAPGDPTWLLVVGPPSGGKTEIISSAAGMPYIVKAATVSEAALLSGTAGREKAANATGGLLRMVGEFGILLCKDFTSVLSQNRDTAKQAMAALREVYDGSWDRPVGTDGGKVLSWAGKCGLVGGVTPSFDRYSTITTALGDRFLLLRLPDVSAAEQAASALNRHDHDAQMRAELAAAMTGLIHGANLDLVGRDLTADEQARLIALACCHPAGRRSGQAGSRTAPSLRRIGSHRR
jgi:hypothetical protein